MAAQGGVRVWRRPPSLARVEAPPAFGTLLVLPGFGNDSSDYAAPFGAADASLLTALRSRGFQAEVLPVERKEWLNVARCLLSPRCYTGSCTADEGYGWYLAKVGAEVERLRSKGERVTLVGHSAGGWLARAFLGDSRWAVPSGAAPGGPHSAVRALVSLGSPHSAPPPGVFDVTRGALSWLNTAHPGAAFASSGVRYLAVAGNTVTGSPPPKGEPARRPDGTREPSAYAAASYAAQLGGDGGGITGDAVVPLRCALLPGAQSLVLDGVWHSVSRVGTFDEDSRLAWYGSDSVVDAWLTLLVEP